MEQGQIVRLEDIIEFATKGRKVEAVFQPRKISVIYKVHPEAEIVEEQEAYLLKGFFSFKVNGESHEIRKIYVRGFLGENMDAALANRDIANARLKTDFQRLKKAGIEIEEKYFESLKIWKT